MESCDDLSLRMDLCSAFDFPLSEEDTANFIEELSSLSNFLDVAIINKPIFSGKVDYKNLFDIICGVQVQLSALRNVILSLSNNSIICSGGLGAEPPI